MISKPNLRRYRQDNLQAILDSQEVDDLLIYILAQRMEAYLKRPTQVPDQSPEEQRHRAILEVDRCRTLLTVVEDFRNFNLDEVYQDERTN